MPHGTRDMMLRKRMRRLNIQRPLVASGVACLALGGTVMCFSRLAMSLGTMKVWPEHLVFPLSLQCCGARNGRTDSEASNASYDMCITRPSTPVIRIISSYTNLSSLPGCTNVCLEQYEKPPDIIRAVCINSSARVAPFNHNIGVSKLYTPMNIGRISCAMTSKR